MALAQLLNVRLLTRPLAGALALALPPRCHGCGLVVDQDDSLCPACWARLRFIGDPRCIACGIPFEIAMGVDALCGACMERPPHFQQARAAVLYDDLPRSILMRFKYGGRPHLARMMARHMRLAARAWLEDEGAVLVPVPLARWRLWRRGYNQAGLIARELQRHCPAVMLPDALVRHRATRVSGTLSRYQRFGNVKGAFRLNERARDRIIGRKVILIDDVMTSGATADSCAQVLVKGGAAAVHVLTWARTPLDG